MSGTAQPARKSASVCLAYLVFLTLTYHLGATVAGILCAALTVYMCFFASKKTGTVLAALLVAASVLGYFSMSLTVLRRDSLRESFDGEKAYVTARVESVTSSNSDRIILRIDTADGKKVQSGFRVSLYRSDASRLNAGDTVNGYLRFKRISDSDGFPSRLYYDGEAVTLSAYADRIYVNVTKPGFSLDGLAADMRRFIKSRLEKFLPNTSALAAGIMLGDKGGIGDGVYGMLSANGITHILCVSGLHVSILIAAVYFVLSPLMLPKRIKRATVCAFALFYMFLTGFSVSVCRAGIMACVAVCDNLTRRRTDSMTSLLLVAAFLCLFEPTAVLSLSFRLSFLATAGVIASQQNVVPEIKKRLGKGICAKICSAILGTLFLSVCVISLCTPVLSAYFGSQSALAPVGNLVCAPIAEMYLVMCFALVPLSFVPYLGTALGTVTDLAGRLFMRLSELLSKSAVFLDISSPVLVYIPTALVFMLILCYILDIKDKTKITLAFAAASVLLMLVSSL